MMTAIVTICSNNSNVLLLKVTSMVTSGLRVTDDAEREGLDLVSHEERGYDIK